MSRLFRVGALALVFAAGCPEDSPALFPPGEAGGSGDVDAPPSMDETPDAAPADEVVDAPPVAEIPDAPPVIETPDAPPGVILADAPPVGELPDGPPIGPLPPMVTYGAAAGVTGPVRDVSTDEAGNVWAINDTSLMLLTPGATVFRAFGNESGLHVQPFTAEDGTPLTSHPTAVAGATANRVYLGYLGYESNDPFNDPLELKQLGNGDRIDYDPATGTIAVHRYEFKCIVEVNRCWEDRSVRRIVVGHAGAAAGHAFFGFNHGTTHVFNDVLGDHVHPIEIWHQTDGTTLNQYGECRALALNDDGTIWIGNRAGVGIMNWNPDPIAWVTAKFKLAFTVFGDGHSLDVPWGYREGNEGASISPDGTVWMAANDKGLTSWNQANVYPTMRHWDPTNGVPATGLVDVTADLDGTVWLVTSGGALLHLDPATGVTTSTTINDARRLYLDKLVTPRALYVGRSTSVTVLR